MLIRCGRLHNNKNYSKRRTNVFMSYMYIDIYKGDTYMKK